MPVERRGIASAVFSKKGGIFRLAKDLQMKPQPLSDEEKVRRFQRKLYQKAKEEKSFRFYVLYDKVQLPYILWTAYGRCRKPGSSPGIDGLTFEEMEKEMGIARFLKEIQTELKEHTYKPSPVKRVHIPKANGKTRPLGIPIIKDRVVQMACKIVIEPIFEADFENCSYGFRPKRSAHNAVKAIKEQLQKGNTEVYDADLSSYFDTIPHKELMFLIEHRISDRNILRLIRMWLKAPISEDGKMSGGKKNKKGTPQGGVISPLLANIYLNLLDKAVKRDNGVFRKNRIQIIRYADDFVLMGKKISRRVIDYLQGMMERMNLCINEEKSTQIDATETPFDFLGFTFRYDRDRYGVKGKYYWNIIPSKKATQKMRDRIRQYLKTRGYCPPKIIARDLNTLMMGWINYFTIPKVSYPQKEKQRLKWYLIEKLERYYARKSQRKSKLLRKGAYKVLTERFGLIDPWDYKRIPAPTKA
jgi:group II intron reverse transcriptase/maturase